MEFKKKPLFLSFEGPEASGKSTQLKILKKFLNKNKIPCIFTREPGGTLISEKLRKIILDKKQNISIVKFIVEINFMQGVIVTGYNQGLEWYYANPLGSFFMERKHELIRREGAATSARYAPVAAPTRHAPRPTPA